MVRLDRIHNFSFSISFTQGRKFSTYHLSCLNIWLLMDYYSRYDVNSQKGLRKMILDVVLYIYIKIVLGHICWHTNSLFFKVLCHKKDTYYVWPQKIRWKSLRKFILWHPTLDITRFHDTILTGLKTTLCFPLCLRQGPLFLSVISPTRDST